MRSIAFLGLAASLIAIPAISESAPQRTVPAGSDWGSVPSIPLRPPVSAQAPAPRPDRGWSSTNGWSGARGEWQGRRGGQPEGAVGGWRGGDEWRGGGGGGGGGQGRWTGDFRPRRGLFIPRTFIAPTYFVSNWWAYGLAQPRAGTRWVRYYDDAVLIDDRGYIHDSVPGIGWEGRGRDRDAYRDGPYRDGPYDDDRSYPSEHRHVTTQGGGVYHVAPGTTVIIQSPPVVTTTTTTTTYYEEVARAPKRAWKPAAKRIVKARPACACK